MKNKKPFVMLLSILLSLALFPHVAKAGSNEMSTTGEVILTPCVDDDDAPVMEDNGTEAPNQEESAKRTVTLPAAKEEAGQEVDASASENKVAVVGANENAASQKEENLPATDDDAVLMKAAPEATNEKLDAADEYAEQAITKTREIYIKPGECIINVDSAKYAINYSKTELNLSGKDIVLENGAFNYNLYANASGKMTYDNDLKIQYQGVDGKYNIHYDMVDTDHHTMIVNGLFYNIMKTSPLLNRYSNRISDDSYAYKLDLRTNEGFTFNNHLDYRFDGKQRDYSVNYKYDLATKTQTLVVSGYRDRTNDLFQTLARTSLLR